MSVRLASAVRSSRTRSWAISFRVRSAGTQDEPIEQRGCRLGRDCQRCATRGQVAQHRCNWLAIRTRCEQGSRGVPRVTRTPLCDPRRSRRSRRRAATLAAAAASMASVFRRLPATAPGRAPLPRTAHRAPLRRERRAIARDAGPARVRSRPPNDARGTAWTSASARDSRPTTSRSAATLRLCSLPGPRRWPCATSCGDRSR